MAKSLLFLPDISGFTNFVNHTELEHSQHIISELLEILINANKLEMTLAEIEGDALFFYKENSIPPIAKIIDQAKVMYQQFHQHLRQYEYQRICQCGACQTAQELELKFVVHAGEINFIQLQGFKKPHGKEVILVHRLMKNKVPINEYLLLTNSVKQDKYTTEPPQVSFRELQDSYDAGTIAYQYADILVFQEDLSELLPLNTGIETKDPIVAKIRIDRPAKELFELISNFRFRALWNTSAKFLYQEDKVNRLGSTHVCIIEDRQIHFETITKLNQKDQMIYGEKTTDIPLLKQASSYFTVTEDNPGSWLTVELHMVPKNFFGWLAKPFMKRQFKKNGVNLINTLKEVAESRADEKLEESP